MMTIEKDKCPLVQGRLNKPMAGVYTLTGHLGDVQRLSLSEYNLIKSMDGFHTAEELSLMHGLTLDDVCKTLEKFGGNKRISDLSEWNQVGWCDKCHVHVAGNACGLCGEKIERIIFSPPCDPFIAFEEERSFILDILRNKFHVDLPKDTFLLVNNGIKDNVFFWEVAYENKIILKVFFTSQDEATWKYKLMSDNLTITKPLQFNEEMIDKLSAGNDRRLTTLSLNAEAFIRESLQIFKTKPLIYFSGGKESLVMLSLFEKFGIEANVITVLTGVEFPEDRDFVYHYKSHIDSQKNFSYYFFEENGENIIDNLKEKKILSAKDPWCRLNFKKELKSKGTKIIYNGSDFVACEGSRWYENDFRRRHPKINFINDYEHQVWIHPIAEWTSFDVWVYLIKNKIPLNPVYTKGFQRTTCWLCPIVNPFHLKCSRKHYPNLWVKISGCKLEAFEDDKSKDLPY